jgi:hypothetical protein
MLDPSDHSCFAFVLALMRPLFPASTRCLRPAARSFKTSTQYRYDRPAADDAEKLDNLVKELENLRQKIKSDNEANSANQQQQQQQQERQPGGAIDTALGIALGTLLLGCGSVAYFAWSVQGVRTSVYRY